MKPGSSPNVGQASRLPPPALFRVTLDAARRPLVSVAKPDRLSAIDQRPSQRGPLDVITRGSVTVKIYGSRHDLPRRRIAEAGPFTIAWKENATGGRQRAMRSDWKRATDLAEQKATELANGEMWRSKVGTDDYGFLLGCYKQAGELHRTKEEIFQKGVEAIRAEASRATIVDKTCPQLVAEMLSNRLRKRKRGQKWLRTLTRMLESFAAHCPGPFHQVRAHHINAWLDTIKGGLDYRFHHRSAVLQLARYAIAHNHAPRDWDELKLVECQGRTKTKIKIWTPEQGVLLLRHTSPSMIPFTVCMAFAMLRHEELNPEQFAINDKVPLDWSDFDWEKNEIHVSEATGKTGERIVPIPPNLVQWLATYRKARGPVCTVKNTSNALTRAKRRAGLPAGPNESRNILRKSAISYRIGQTNNRGQVAEEAGTSLAKIKTNYRRAATTAQARAWYDIEPTAGEILQLNFATM